MMVMGLAVALALAGDRACSSRLEGAGRRRRGAAVLHVLLHAVSRRLGRARRDRWYSYFAFTTTRLASFASLVAIVAPVAAVLWRLRDLGTLFSATADDALRTLQGHTLLRWSLAALLVTVRGAGRRSFSCSAPCRGRAGCGSPPARRCSWCWWPASAAARGAFSRAAAARPGSKDRVQTFIAGTDETDADEGRRPAHLAEHRPAAAVARGSRAVAFAPRCAAPAPAPSPSRTTVSATTGASSSTPTASGSTCSASWVRSGSSCSWPPWRCSSRPRSRNPFADRGDPSRPLLVALQAGMVAFVVHISWDWDWDMAAIGTVFFLFAAACSSYLATGGRTTGGDRRRPRPHGGRRRGGRRTDGCRSSAAPAPARRRRVATWPVRTVATLALVLLAVSWLVAVPVGARRERGAHRRQRRRHRRRPRADARRAARLDPLAVDPLITEALVLQQLGRNGEALAVLRKAARLQPDNYEVYLPAGRSAAEAPSAARRPPSPRCGARSR